MFSAFGKFQMTSWRKVDGVVIITAWGTRRTALVQVNKTHTINSQAHTRGSPWSPFSLEQEFSQLPKQPPSAARFFLFLAAHLESCAPGEWASPHCVVCSASALGIFSRQVCVASSFITGEMHTHSASCHLWARPYSPLCPKLLLALTCWCLWATECSQPGSP